MTAFFWPVARTGNARVNVLLVYSYRYTDIRGKSPGYYNLEIRLGTVQQHACMHVCMHVTDASNLMGFSSGNRLINDGTQCTRYIALVVVMTCITMQEYDMHCIVFTTMRCLSGLDATIRSVGNGKEEQYRYTYSHVV